MLCKVGVISLLTLLLAMPMQAPTQSQEGADLASVIDAIRDCLKEAQSNNVAGFPPLKSVEITLQVLAAKEGGLKISFLVFTIGSTVSSESTSTVKLTMVPPTTRKGGTASINPIELKRALASAINTAKAGVLAANEKAEPPLHMSNIELEVAFTVKKAGEAGIELQPIGLGGSGKLSKNSVHTLKLVFGS